jgi:hypothetical protein
LRSSKINKGGRITLAGASLRSDGHLMHAIAAGALRGTWPSPLSTSQLANAPGARAAATPLPPPPLPAGSIRAQRRAHASDRIMVNNQFIKLGPSGNIEMVHSLYASHGLTERESIRQSTRAARNAVDEFLCQEARAHRPDDGRAGHARSQPEELDARHTRLVP